MRKVAIVTDSTCCLPQELVEKYEIYEVPLQILHEGKSYRDGIDISPGEVYEIMRRRENLPTTSTPPAGDFLNAYRQLAQEAESILCITLTSLQSKVFEAASTAREIAKDESLSNIIEVLDSRSVSGALGFIVLEAARKASQGAGLAEVVEVAKSTMGRVHFLGVLDTLYYLARTGRLARAAAWAGALLNLKPLLEHNPAIGETTPVSRPRTTLKAVEHMLEIMSRGVGDSTIHVMVHHADDLERAEELMAEIESRFSCTELYLTEFTPVMGVHTGPGLLAIAFYAD